MPSVNKTTNLGLNQWASNEYPKRLDFVEDNAAIDGAVGKLANLVTTDKTNLVAAVNEVKEQNNSLAAKVIAESGSNANGSYVKFEDGTMICFATVSSSTSATTSLGSFYTTGALSWTYPATFIANPQLTYSITADQAGLWPGHILTLTSTSCSMNILSAASRATVNISRYLIAIGRWK